MTEKFETGCPVLSCGATIARSFRMPSLRFELAKALAFQQPDLFAVNDCLVVGKWDTYRGRREE